MKHLAGPGRGDPLSKGLSKGPLSNLGQAAA